MAAQISYDETLWPDGYRVSKTLTDILNECESAQGTHGDLPVSAHQRLGILLEEVGEVAKAMNRHTWDTPCAEEVRAELVQVAATALRMIAAHDQLTISTSL